MSSMPGEKRNGEVYASIARLEQAQTTNSIDKEAAIANTLASLNLAESIQEMTGLLSESIRSNSISLERSIGKLIDSNQGLAASNEKHSTMMVFLTGALVFVAFAQVYFTYMQARIAITAAEGQSITTDLEVSKWKYEVDRNTRLEARDIEWRKQDLERR